MNAAAEKGMNLLRNTIETFGLTAHRSKYFVADSARSPWDCLSLFNEHHFVSLPWARWDGANCLFLFHLHGTIDLR